MKVVHFINNKTILLTLCLSLFSLGVIKAQAISGPTSMTVGQQKTFSIPFGDPNITWSVSNTSRAQIIGLTGGTSVQVRALSTGTFSVNVQLSGGSDSKTVTVSPTPTPAKPSTPTSSIANCAVTLTRGNPPFGVTWYWQTSTGGTSNSNPLQSFNPSSNGTYYLRARANVTSNIWGPASNGVSVSIPANPSVPIANVGQPSCAVPTGTITITSPTTSGNTYSFNNGATYQSSPTKSGLAPNNYTLRVKNSIGCVSASTVYVVQNPPSPPANPTVTHINPTCSTLTGTITITGPTININGYSFDNGASYQTSATKTGLALGNYIVKVKTWDGCISGGTTINIASPLNTPAVPTATKTDSNCTTATGSITITSPTTSSNTYSFDNGLNYQTSTYKSGLAAGTYTIRVKNTAGCVSPGTAITIASAPSTPSAPIANVGQPSCAVPTGTITITSPTTSGNTYSFNNGATYQSSPTKSGLASGNYTLKVQNITGCISAGIVVSIEQISNLNTPILSGVVQPLCSTALGSFTITNLDPSYSYEVSPSNGISVSGATVIGPAGSYTVTASYQNCSSPVSEIREIIAPSNACPGSGTRNYIYSRTYQEEKAIAPNFFTQDEELIQQITYFDGVGRPSQQIAIHQTPNADNKQDIVTAIDYNGYGRVNMEYLPYPETDGNLATFRSTAKILTSAHYDSQKYQNTSNPFSEKEFENSPLNRLLKQAAPGNDWAMGGGHEIEFDYMSNTISDNVRLFEVDYANAQNTESPTLINGVFYIAGDLYKTVTYDENHTGTSKNHSTEEYTDKQGRVVLKRTYADVPAMDLNNDGDTLDLGEQAKTEAPHDTYYVYGDYGNLTYVLPPKMEASEASLVDINSALNDLGYQYVYDHRNRLVDKKIPGKEWEHIVYNKLDQPIMTQDANQRTSGEWLFTKYDAFGRVAYTGKATSTVGTTRTAVQDEVDGLTGNLWVARGAQTTFGGADISYNDGAYPTATTTQAQLTEILTINYYDDYDFDRANEPGPPADVFGQPMDSRTKGLATGSKIKVLDVSPARWITTVTRYDDKARPIYTYSENAYLGTVDRVGP